MIAVNDRGDMFLDYLVVAEESVAELQLDGPLTHALAVVQCDGKFLLMFNRFRQAWELPGGIIEPNETPRECVIREVEEETGQAPDALLFCGLMKFQLHPDGRIEYGALFSAHLAALKPFIENAEAERIILWDRVAPLSPIEEIDRTIVELCASGRPPT